PPEPERPRAEGRLAEPFILRPGARVRTHGLPELVRENAETIVRLGPSDVAPLVERLGSADVVLLGEATHGTSEFYALRALITRGLVERHGCVAVAIEGDWPDAARIDRFVRDRPSGDGRDELFSRFPTWMW